MDAQANQDILSPALPRYVQVEVTGACNLRCRMCIVRYRPGHSIDNTQRRILHLLLKEIGTSCRFMLHLVTQAHSHSHWSLLGFYGFSKLVERIAIAVGQ